MGFVERHRAEIVVLIVLPISLLLWVLREAKRFLLSPRPSEHGLRVVRVAASVRALKSGNRLLRTDRSVHDSHSVRCSDKSQDAKVELRALYAILGCENGIVHVEPGARVGEVTRYLLSRGLQLECTLEMVDATLGGLAMATGMTTHSHVCGLIHETVEEYELVMADGSVVIAKKNNEHADLWRALPWSHGTLGMLVSLKLRVVPSKRYVRLKYIPCRSRASLRDGYMAVLRAAELGSADVPFFVESIVFSREEAVLMHGHLVDCASSPTSSDLSVNSIGWWWKPWFFKHVESKLLRPDGEETEELIPIYDYLMRHDRSMCMTMGTIIPYGNKPWFRVLFGWMLPPLMSFLKASHTEETREASLRKQVYQDVAFPATRLDDALDKVDKLFGIFPLLLYPCKAVDHGGMLRVPGGGTAEKPVNHMFLNLGVYGIPAEVRACPKCGFPTLTKVRELERFIRHAGGFQHTYCDSMQSEEEFRKMFDHELWEAMRKRYGCEGVFPTVFAKTRPERDVRAWLVEEEASFNI